MSQSEYARHRGVSKQAVSKIKDKLVFDPESGKVDVAASDRALGDVRERVNIRDDGAGDAPPAAGTYTPPGDGAGLTKAKTATEIYRARLAQLEYDEKVGRLLQRDDVLRSTRILAEAIVADLEMLPNMAPELAAAFRQGDEIALRGALKKFTRQAQATLAENLRRIGAAGAAAEEGGAGPSVQVT